MMNNRFMIGQFGLFDERKYRRDYRSEFFGIEACFLESQEDIDKLVYLSSKDDFKIGIHFPLRSNRWRLRDPQYMSLDSDTRRQSYDYIRDEINFIKDIKPEYILFHYPKPVVLSTDVDWSMWRFADDSEFLDESQITYEDFKEKSLIFFKWINDISIVHNTNIVLELDAINKYLWNTDLLETLLTRYPRIEICLDLGRLHLQEQIDNGFDSFEFVYKYAKYAKLVHVWNVKVSSNLEHSHYPALPGLDINEGWGDIRKYVSIINSKNKTCKYLFEHNSSIITDDELDNCYKWLNEMISE